MRGCARYLIIVLLITSFVLAAAPRRAVGAASGGLTVTPASGVPGQVVTLSAPPGSLPGGQNADVDFVDATSAYVGVRIAKTPVHADGSIQFSVAIVPQAAAGTAHIVVLAGGASISVPFEVRPTLTIAPQAAQQGTAVVLSGSGFNANAAITLQSTIPGQATQPLTGIANQTTFADLLGTFTTLISVPRAPAGQLVIAAGDSVYTATATMGVIDLSQISAPAVPGAVSPPPAVTPTGGGAPPPAISVPAGPTTAYFAEGFTGQAHGAAGVNFGESLNIFNPGTVPAVAHISYTVGGSSRPVLVDRTVPAGSALRESVNADVGPDRTVAATVTSPARLFVTRTITRVLADGTRLDASTAAPVAAPSRSWGFPEGYTGSTFQEYLTLLNPNAVAATVRLTLAPQGDNPAAARTVTLHIPARARSTANIRALNLANPVKEVAMLVASDQPVVSERVEYFGSGSGSAKFGATVGNGIAAPSTSWLLPYGTAGGNQQFITLLNPARSGAASVTVRYSDAAGRTIGQTRLSIKGGTRKTVTAGSVLSGKTPAPFSVGVQSTAPIEAEAAQYFGGSPNTGVHPGVAYGGLAAPSSEAFFSELSGQLADGTLVSRVVYLTNPGTAPITVYATYFGAATPAPASYVVPAGGVVTVPVLATNNPLGAVFQAATGTFNAVAVGLGTDGRTAVAEVGSGS